MAKTWIDKFISGGSLFAILVALLGQAIFSIVWQIRNNEQQQAKIDAAVTATNTLRSEIVNLQTPLSSLVLKMEGRLSAMEVQHAHLEKSLISQDEKLSARIDSIDKGGTRELNSLSTLIARMNTQLDRSSERIIIMEKVLTDIQGQINLVNNTLKSSPTFKAPRP